MGREKLRQVVSHLEQRGEQVSPKPPFPLCQHLQLPLCTGPHRKATVGGPRASETPQSKLTQAWGGFAGLGPSLTHSQRLSLGTTCQFPGNWKRLWRFFRVSSWLCVTDSMSSLTFCNLLKWGTVKAACEVAATAWKTHSLKGHHDS